MKKVNKASKCTGPLFVWIKAQIEFSDIKERVEPLRLQVISLQKESEGLIQKHKEVEISISHLENSIAQYKNEYATLIKETEQKLLEAG